ncbi:MAG: tRNA (adenosine(37)-N6)-threonylcarbamoyltransferase complex ATPase subunit type 1 TsaE, partial [candidate division WOR-3 bacterium]
SPDRTREIGGLLTGFVVPGTFIALFGALGTGKTELVRGFVESLGLAGVKSPSFTIANIYEKNGLKVYHFDLYRLHGPVDAEETGLLDALAQKDGFIFMEWADNADWLPPERLDVALTHMRERERAIELISYLDWFDGEGFTAALNERGFRYEIY